VVKSEKIEAWRLEVRVLQQRGIHKMKSSAKKNLLGGHVAIAWAVDKIATPVVAASSESVAQIGNLRHDFANGPAGIAAKTCVPQLNSP